MARILIVEDEVITAMDIREMVRAFGYASFGPVRTGNEAIATTLSLRPDLILMDIVLKGRMTGIEAAKAIRSQIDCHVIFLTGSSDRVNAELAEITEPFGLVLKPIDEEELHTAISKALQQPDARKSLRNKHRFANDHP